MKTSDSIAKIAPALLEAQRAIRFAVKDGKNPHLKNSYATLPSVIDAVKAPLNDNGIVFIQTLSDSDGKPYLTITTRLIHTSGEWIEDTANIPLQKADAQGFGSAASYGRRYCLSAITGLYQDDDDGHAAVQKPTQSPQVVDTDTGEVMERKSPKQQLEEAKTLQQLQALFAKFWQGSDGKTQKQLKQTYDVCKSKFVEVVA